MLIRFIVFVTTMVLALHGGPAAAQTQDPSSNPGPFSRLIENLREQARGRDSLMVALQAQPEGTNDVLEELLWQRDTELYNGLMMLVDKVDKEQARGADVAEVRRILSQGLQMEWPRYKAQLQKREHALVALRKSSEAAADNERLAIESEMSRQSDRLLEGYQSLMSALLALERVGVDISEQRADLVHRIPLAAQGMVTRLKLAKQEQDSAAALLSRDASNAGLRYAYEASEERVKRATRILSTAISLMNRLGLETTNLRVDLISTTGRVTADVFQWKVMLGLLKTVWLGFVELLAVKAPQWLFQGLLIALSFFGFRALARIVRRVVRRAVSHSKLSELMRTTIVRLSVNAVWLIGFFVILTQLGVQVAPLLAGLGIAGIAVGFAMQNTLSNFAAGGMILGNQPFDVGDEIEVAGVVGTVKKMTLVSTTILTADNQTLIIPNSTVWGGVIRNRTAQPTRRVDLAFNIGYKDDLEKAERALREVVSANQHVLKEPAPIIKVNQLADTSVGLVVRVWTVKEQYWDVYWDLTRAIKLALEQEGIVPLREMRLTVDKGGSEGVLFSR